MSQPDAPVILVGCQKGGIGRTVVATNLAAMLALAGRPTLLIDLDPKGDATASVGLERIAQGRTAARLSEPWSFLEDCQPARRPAGLDVWGGGPGLEPLATELARAGEAGTQRLDPGLRLARQRYRAVVIDTPPDLGPLARNALAAADVLLIPITESAFVAQALEATIDTACCLRRDMRVFAVRLARDGEGRAIDPEATGPLGVELLETVLALDGALLNEAAGRGLPVFEHAPASRAARCFLELGREVIEKIVEGSVVSGANSPPESLRSR